MGRYNIAKDYTCVDGRKMRHDPQIDDPYLQTDVGRCQDCDGEGCNKIAASEENDDNVG